MKKLTKPVYVDGLEVKRPEPITVEHLQKIHDDFWAAQQPPLGVQPAPRHPGEAAFVQEAALILLRQIGEVHAKEKAETATAISTRRALQTVNATAGRLDMGDSTRDLVRREASKLIERSPAITRAELARQLVGVVDLEESYLLKLLTKLGIPSRKKSRDTSNDRSKNKHGIDRSMCP